jgi:hypothetical protein
MTRLASLSVLSLLAATAVRAGQASNPPPRAGDDRAPASSVSPLVVTGGAAPKLVASFPKAGATVSAGLVVVSLQFDQDMSEKDSALASTPLKAGEDPAPPCLAKPRRLADGKTLVFLCGATPGKAYEFTIPAATSGLVSASGRSAAPALIRFSANATIVDNLADALEEAGLTADDDPIMTSAEVNTPPDSAPPPLPATASNLSGPVRRPLDSPSPHS